MGYGEEPVRNSEFWDPKLNPPVNKRNLSTDKTERLANFSLQNRGFSIPPQRSPFQLENAETTKDVQNVWDSGGLSPIRCCQNNGRLRFV